MRLLGLAIAVLLALPGAALAETSPGVSLVSSIPERGVVSARADSTSTCRP